MKPCPFPPTLDLDILRALQICYYVNNLSLISDYHFDMMEQLYEKETGESLPVGSESLDSYTEAQRALALYLQFTFGRRRS